MMMKKILSVCLAVIFSLGIMMPAAQLEFKANAASKNYGLTVDDNGTLLLDGKPFYAFGTNLYDAFQRNLTDPLGATYKESFALVKKYNIPFVRIPFSGYQQNAYDLYDQDKEGYFSYMDAVVAEAEKQNIGIIASLMWWDPALSAHVGEKRSDMGKTNSKTMKYAKQYVSDIVKRYVNRPGIWGWEIGNEYNLGADLCDRSFQSYLWPGATNTNGFDYYTSAELQVFYREISKEIRKYDDYRMITSGNGDMRGASKAMNAASSKMDSNHLWNVDWSVDSLLDFYDMNAYFHPDPMDTICFHLQHGTLNGNPPAYDLNISRWGRTITQKQYYQEYANAGKRAKKAVFFGEFGDFMDMEDDKDMYQQFTKIMEDIRDAGIQIAATWQFYFEGGGQVVSDVGKDGYKLGELSKFNLADQKAGKQDTSKAWVDVKTEQPATSSNPTSQSTSGSSSKPTVNTGSSANGNSVSHAESDSVLGTDSEKTDEYAVDSYMRTSSTKLEILANTMEILIEKPVSLDVFRRSIALKNGYTMKVCVAGSTEEITDETAEIGSGCLVMIYNPQSEKLNEFTVSVKEQESESKGVTLEPEPNKGFGIGTVILIVILCLVVLAGGGFALYYFVLRKKYDCFRKK